MAGRVMFMLALIVCIAVSASLVWAQSGEGIAITEEIKGIPVDDLMTIEFNDGTRVVAMITRETNNEVFLQNVMDTMEVSMPRSKIANIRKPTTKELNDLRKRVAAPSPAQAPEEPKTN